MTAGIRSDGTVCVCGCHSGAALRHVVPCCRLGVKLLLPPSKTEGWKRIERTLARVERVSDVYSFMIFEDGHKLGTHHYHSFDVVHPYTVH